MALAYRSGTVLQSDTGRTYAGVRVLPMVDGVAQPIYADASGTPLSEAITNGNGAYEFWVETGTYDLDYSLGGQHLGVQTGVEIYSLLKDGAEIVPLVGDASFRRYFRLRMGDRSAMLMHAPPPEEDTGPFLHVARWLNENGMRGPEILGARPEEGLVLLEDFGDQRMKEWIDDHPQDESAVYARAIDALVKLQSLPAGPGT